MCCDQQFVQETDFKAHYFHTSEHLAEFHERMKSSISSSSSSSFSTPSIDAANNSKRFCVRKEISSECGAECRSAGRVLLFYVYGHIACPASFAAEQASLCQRLVLRGKIRVSCEGINCTVSGAIGSLIAYKTLVQTHFPDPIHWKERCSSSSPLAWQAEFVREKEKKDFL